MPYVANVVAKLRGAQVARTRLLARFVGREVAALHKLVNELHRDRNVHQMPVVIHDVKVVDARLLQTLMHLWVDDAPQRAVLPQRPRRPGDADLHAAAGEQAKLICEPVKQILPRRAAQQGAVVFHGGRDGALLRHGYARSGATKTSETVYLGERG